MALIYLSVQVVADGRNINIERLCNTVQHAILKEREENGLTEEAEDTVLSVHVTA